MSGATVKDVVDELTKRGLSQINAEVSKLEQQKDSLGKAIKIDGNKLDTILEQIEKGNETLKEVKSALEKEKTNHKNQLDTFAKTQAKIESDLDDKIKKNESLLKKMEHATSVINNAQGILNERKEKINFIIGKLSDAANKMSKEAQDLIKDV